MDNMFFSLVMSQWANRRALVFVLILLFSAPVICLAASLPGQSQIQEGGVSLSPEEDGHIKELEVLRGSSRNGRTVVEIPPSKTGTGYSEWIEYRIPSNYYPGWPGHALLVCWHGYGQSCLSVAIDSLLDEECEDRDWIYLSITGAIENNFGWPIAQIHCTKAIDYLIDDLELYVNTSRIYMAGYSMGGAAAASYTCRHMDDREAYPVAGLMVVASTHDWIDAYNQGDLGAMSCLPGLLGGTPSEVPFKYKQISSLYLDQGEYVLDESMGQNLRHGLPIFVSYAGNDPATWIVSQNEKFVGLMTDIGANLQVDYKAVYPFPHHWSLLDVESAFDFIEPYWLEDQQTDSITFLADRDAKFYWATVTQTAEEIFSKVSGEVDSDNNTLDMTESTNTDAIRVDCEKAGLDDKQNLMLTYQSSSPEEQLLELKPMATEPTYVVDEYGVLYPDTTYDPGLKMVSITRLASADLDLKVSYEAYNLTLVSDDTVVIGQSLSFDLGGGDPGDPFLLFLSLTQIETKIGIRHLLVDPFFPAIWILGNLDGLGEASFNIPVPYEPTWVGLIVYQQFLTYDPTLKEISNMEVTELISSY